MVCFKLWYASDYDGLQTTYVSSLVYNDIWILALGK